MTTEPRRSSRLKKDITPIEPKIEKPTLEYQSLMDKYIFKCEEIFKPEIVTDTEPIVFYIIGSAGSGKSKLYNDLFVKQKIRHNYYNLDTYYEKLLPIKKEFETKLIKIYSDKPIEERLQKLTLNSISEFKKHIDAFDKKILTTSAMCAKKDLQSFITSKQMLVIDTTGGYTFTQIYNQVSENYFPRNQYVILVDVLLPICIMQNKDRDRILDTEIIIRNWISVQKNITNIQKLFINRFYRYAPATRNIEYDIEIKKLLKPKEIQKLIQKQIDRKESKSLEDLKTLVSTIEYQEAVSEPTKPNTRQRQKTTTQRKKADTPHISSTQIKEYQEENKKIINELINVHNIVYNDNDTDEAEINKLAIQELIQLITHTNVVIIWGRFQPPHIGHEQIFKQAYENYGTTHDIYIMPSSTCDYGIPDKRCIIAKNPLTIEEKLIILGNMYPEYHFMYLHSRNIVKILELFSRIYSTGNNKNILLCGPDRYSDYIKFESKITDLRVEKYNNTSPDKKAERFSIKFDRYPKPLEISATLVRNAIYYHQYSILQQTLARGTYTNEKKFKEELLPIITRRIKPIDSDTTVRKEKEAHYMQQFNKAIKLEPILQEGGTRFKKRYFFNFFGWRF